MCEYIYSRKENKSFVSLVIFVCILTNISQMPAIVNAGYTRFFSVPLWALLGIVCFIKQKKIPYHDISKQIMLFLLFGIYYGIATVINSSFSKSSLPYPILLCCYIMIVGYSVGNLITISSIDAVLTGYVISVAFVCLDIFRTYVYGRSLSVMTFAYASKNSVSQLLLSAWLIVFFIKFGKTKGLLKRVFYISLFFLLTITLLGLKSRATIIGMPVAVIWALAHGKIDRKAKRAVILIVVSVTLLLIFRPQYYDMLINNILLNNRSASNLQEISSGRYSQWQNFGSEFKDSWFFGKGSSARESLVLTALLEFGVVGGSLIFALALSPLRWFLKGFDPQNPYYLFCSSLAIVYVMNGIFEQLAPFGPGVKCYLLWFLYGVFSHNHMNWINDEALVE